MINFDHIIKKETKEHSRTWPDIPDHLYRILIIGGSGSGKTDSLFDLINQQPDTDKIQLYAKDLNEARYNFLIKKQKVARKQHFIDSKVFI